MIKQILVTNANGEYTPLILMQPETSGFILINVDGLGPVKSNINLRDNAGASGSIFNSARSASRNIVLSLLFLNDGKWPIEWLRLQTYKYFPNESKIRLDVTTDAGTYYIYGYVESNELNIFSKNEGTVISIICPDPYFRPTDGTVYGKVESVAKSFEFEFSNEVGTKSIIFGERFYQTEDFDIPLELGSANIEPTLLIKAEGGQVKNPRISFTDNDGVRKTLKFVFTTGLPALSDGDTLEIVCEKGKKSVTRHVKANGSDMNYIGTVGLDSSWPVLRPGTNLYSLEADDNSAAYARLSYSFEPKHIGV